MEVMKNKMQCKLFINGKWESAQSGEYFEVTDPASGEVLCQAALGGKQDVQKAIDAASEAFISWSSMSVWKRSGILMNIYKLILEHESELAKIITMEMGKPLHQALFEVRSAAEYILWNAEEGKRVYGKSIPSSEENKRLQVIYQPVGPVAAITPWNFPLSMIARKVAPALSAGCTVILKPAEQTPISAIRFFELAERAGVPKGVMNLITGNPEVIGEELLTNKRVRKITFTGSTPVGKMLMEKAAKQVKRISMELGGHAPFIVFEDADMDLAVESLVQAKFMNCGQTCISPNRIYVNEKIKDLFLEKLQERVKTLKVGCGVEKDVDLGPLINKHAYEKISIQITDSIEKGAELVTGGKRKEIPKCEKGYFFEPTIIANINENMKIVNEETFGPIIAISTFRDEHEVVNKANNTDYGLAAYFFTNDLSRTVRVSELLEYGMVGVNDAALAQVQGPFGGVKESGIGREGGPDCLQDFIETKFISTKFHSKI